LKAFVEKITRPSRKWTDQFIIAAILSVVLLVAGSVVSDIIYKATDAPSLFEKWLGSDNLAAFFSEYLMFIGIWIITFLFVVVPKSNRPMLKAWGYNRDGNNNKGIIAGALLGFGCNGFCVLMSVLMGDIKLSFYGFNPTILLAFLLVVMIQSGAEEITDRLYLYQKLRRRYKSPLFAIIINPVVFMLLHVVNDGFTVLAGVQIVLVGIIFSVLVYYYNSLWAAIWFHTLWNYTQNIIFGLPNSGRVSDYSIFKLEAASAQSGLFYDVGFGVEGSIGSSLVLALVLAVIIFINRGKGEKRDYWADAASDAGYESKH
jgi:membrane protease YdiL (CAAX protease family)